MLRIFLSLSHNNFQIDSIASLLNDDNKDINQNLKILEFPNNKVDAQSQNVLKDNSNSHMATVEIEQKINKQLMIEIYKDKSHKINESLAIPKRSI